LPGGDGTGQLFHRQLESLESTFDIRCLEIPPDDMTGWNELADQVIHLVKQELTQSPRPAVYLCGESFGGCLALRMMQRAPQLFDRLILVNPASAFRRHSWLYSLSYWVRPVPEAIYRIFWVWFLPILASLGRINADDRRALLNAVQLMSQETSIWRLSLLRAFQISDRDLTQIQQPTLVIASGRDLILPSIEEAEFLVAAMPQAQFYVLPDSGHACLLESDVHLYEILADRHFLPEPGLRLPPDLPEDLPEVVTLERNEVKRGSY
jgi:pimeloyl-ACP methyl ester carboxylesterase